MTPVEGVVDCVEDGWVLGWAWRPDLPQEPLELTLLLDGLEVARFSAGLYRVDLATAGKGDGKHAFEARLPDDARDGGQHVVRVVYGGLDLHGSPYAMRAAGTANSIRREDAVGATYASAFGGLWPDLSNAEAVIEGKRLLGWISDDEAHRLHEWRRDGMVVLPQAVAHHDIDQLDGEVEDIWAGRSRDHYFVEYWENGARTVQPAGPSFRDQPVKLLDLFTRSVAARRVMFAAPVQRFLSILFEGPALAFQSLYFRWGSQQEVHQDSAFVRVSSPREFAASWVALEDIRPYSGELRYYPGSHLLEDYLFEGNSKWMPYRSAEYGQYVASLKTRCTSATLSSTLFRARKGDVLLWHADLAHGGSEDVSAGATRKSLVTHYCPLHRRPATEWGSQGSRRHEWNALAYYSYASRV